MPPPVQAPGSDGPYRAHPEWTLASEHRVSPLYRAGFVIAALLSLAFVGAMLRSVLFGPFALEASSSVGVWLLLGFLVALTSFFSFVAARASSGRVVLHREGVVLTDLVGRTNALRWSEIKKVTRLHRSGGSARPSFSGWALHRGDGTSMLIPTMYAGVAQPLERLAREHRLALEDEHR